MYIYLWFDGYGEEKKNQQKHYRQFLMKEKNKFKPFPNISFTNHYIHPFTLKKNKNTNRHHHQEICAYDYLDKIIIKILKSSRSLAY